MGSRGTATGEVIGGITFGLIQRVRVYVYHIQCSQSSLVTFPNPACRRTCAHALVLAVFALRPATTTELARRQRHSVLAAGQL